MGLAVGVLFVDEFKVTCADSTVCSTARPRSGPNFIFGGGSVPFVSRCAYYPVHL